MLQQVVKRIQSVFAGHKKPSVTRSEWIDKYQANLRARYDAAQTSIENERHWAQADFMSPNASVRPEVRKTVRSRARYEFHESNSYAVGIVQSLANDMIGRGPRVRCKTPSREFNRQVKDGWRHWCMETNFAQCLRTMRVAKCIDGEAFGEYVTNTRLRDVQLDIRRSEADLWTDPNTWTDEEHYHDGIRFDRSGVTPMTYTRLRRHPGDLHGGTTETRTLDAAQVLHWYKESRPDQKRGMSEVVSCLPLFAMWRRYMLSVIACAETAADYSGIMYASDKVSDAWGTDAVDEFLPIDIEKRMLTTLPVGYRMEQLKAEQPTNTIEQFRDIVIQEVCRCTGQPFNVAVGTSKGHNMSSGKLDRLGYAKTIDVDRHDLECCVINKTFDAWYDEASSMGMFTASNGLREGDYLSRSFYWDPQMPVDEKVAASATETLFSIGRETDEQWMLSNGIDPDEWEDSMKRQQETRTALGLPLPGVIMQQIDDKTSNDSETEETAEAISRGDFFPSAHVMV